MSQIFYIFRHGIALKKGEEYGDRIFTQGLLPEGVPAIKKIGEYLKNIPTDFNVSSEIKRCRQSAEIVTEITGKPFSFDKRINEYHAESFGSVEQRVESFLMDLGQKKYQTILICTHGAIIGALKSLIIKDHIFADSLLDFPDPGIIWKIEDKKLTPIEFNK